VDLCAAYAYPVESSGVFFNSTQTLSLASGNWGHFLTRLANQIIWRQASILGLLARPEPTASARECPGFFASAWPMNSIAVISNRMKHEHCSEQIVLRVAPGCAMIRKSSNCRPTLCAELLGLAVAPGPHCLMLRSSIARLLYSGGVVCESNAHNPVQRS
jgi:hypothetical protein